MNWLFGKKKKKGRHRFVEYGTNIVPVIANFPDKEKKAAEILRWLVEIKAVQPELSECINTRSYDAYAIDKGAKKLSTRPRDLPFNESTNGLEIVLKRTIFDSGSTGIEFAECPVCKTSPNIIDISKDYKLHGISKIKCSNCECEIEINEFIYHPVWAFSDLGFVFWGWGNFRDSFINEFEKRLGCKVKIVEYKLENIDYENGKSKS
jgi:hypothetical protein